MGNHRETYTSSGIEEIRKKQNKSKLFTVTITKPRIDTRKLKLIITYFYGHETVHTTKYGH